MTVLNRLVDKGVLHRRILRLIEQRKKDGWTRTGPIGKGDCKVSYRQPSGYAVNLK
jgi:hypothetical protein